MNVKVKKEFLDRAENMKQRKVGDTYDTTSERARYLSILGFVDVIKDKPVKLKSETTKQTN